ncbi:MAG: hypothetical protein KAF27_09390 [Porphyrobacter sp.]|nr:hypothetical protein [Porphyrobacter sp.]
MIQLPDALRRLPFVFYALAAILFVWNLGNQWVVMSAMTSMSDVSLDGLVTGSQKSAALYRAVIEAAYMVANGAMLHALIAIFDKLKGTGE